MKQVIKIQTFDGKVWNTTKEAKRHLETLYGNVLLNIGKVLTHQKYSIVCDYIDSNLHLFAELRTIKKDLETFEKLNDNE